MRISNKLRGFRDIAIYKWSQDPDIKVKEIGELFDLTDSQVYNIIKLEQLKKKGK